MVIELKRDEVGAHMELQALRYAAMIANMTFDKACEYFAAYIEQEKKRREALERQMHANHQSVLEGAETADGEPKIAKKPEDERARLMEQKKERRKKK